MFHVFTSEITKTHYPFSYSWTAWISFVYRESLMNRIILKSSGRLSRCQLFIKAFFYFVRDSHDLFSRSVIEKQWISILWVSQPERGRVWRLCVYSYISQRVNCLLTVTEVLLWKSLACLFWNFHCADVIFFSKRNEINSRAEESFRMPFTFFSIIDIFFILL